MSDINPADIKIVFMGTPEFASECLRVLHDSGYNVVLAVTQPDKPVGRKETKAQRLQKHKIIDNGQCIMDNGQLWRGRNHIKF